MKKVLGFHFERETPGAVRYYEVNNAGEKLQQKEATIGTVYLRKSSLNGTIPQQLEITIESK